MHQRPALCDCTHPRAVHRAAGTGACAARGCRCLKFHRPPKYGAVKVAGYDSKDEAYLGQQLHLAVLGGAITELVEHPLYELHAANPPDRPSTWRPDFRYREDGRLIVHECKGCASRDWPQKRRAFRERYPWIELRVSTRRGREFATQVYPATEPEPTEKAA